MKRMLEPFPLSIILSVALVIGGFVGVGFGWYGAAKSLDVYIQLPYLLTGGFVGIALIGTGLVVIRIQDSRRHAALEIERFDQITRSITSVLSALKSAQVPD